MFYRFQFESEHYPILDRLPLHARMKLDLAGVKLSLQQWLAFSLEERRVICHLPVESDEELEVFAAYLNFLCLRYDGAPAQKLPRLNPALWDTPGRIPEPVVGNSRDNGQVITVEEWTHWQFHQRYGLYKTAVSKNEPEKFAALLAELRQRKAHGNH
jgi:hypothetical protein